MANSPEGTDEVYEKDREYLCEWPPVEVKTQNDSEKSKKRKLPDKDYDIDEKYVDARKDILGCSHEFPLARPALAKWWRKRLQITNKQDMSSLPKSSNPNTLLKYLASLPEGKEFLNQQVCILQKETALHPRCAAFHVALASYYDILKDVNAAFHSLEIATKLRPFDREIAWLHLKVQRQKALDDQRRCLEENVSICKLGECQMPKPVEIKRHHYSVLDTKEFLFQYCVSRKPVIITGMVEHMTTVPWDMQHVKEVVGNKNVLLKRMVKESTEWAKLEPACHMTVATFIDSLHSVPELLYLFDWSLPTNAPELVKELHIPKFFAGDFLQRTTPGSLYKDSWPSLFIAPAGLHSDLHVDAFGSNFWMALFEGRKRWTFFNAEDVPLLYPRREDSLDLVFDVDLSSPDFDAHPLLCRTTPIQCILEPGELLFVPHGCPHRVENIEDSLAISANFVDLSNFHVVIEELKGNALLDPRAEDLLTQMRKDSFPTKMFSQETDLPWYQFKTWPRFNYKDYDIDIKDMQNWNQHQDTDHD